MGRFQSCKTVVERALRRAFYDGVLELYEGHGNSDTVTAVTLEGTLTLTINRNVNFLIRLNEVAQRAEEMALEGEDTVQDAPEGSEGDQLESSDKETEISNRERKFKLGEGLEEENKSVIKLKQEVKMERGDCHDMQHVTCNQDTAKPMEVAKELNTIHQKNQMPEQTIEMQPEHGMIVSTSHISVKKEPEQYPVDVSQHALPGPSNSSFKTVPEESITSDTKTDESPLPSSIKAQYEQFQVVKKEPKAEVESIVIDDDDDDDDVKVDSNYPTSSQVTHTSPIHSSPIHSLWYKKSQGSWKHRAAARDRSLRKNYLNSHQMDMADPQQMALLLERNDCPVCGEVLHSRQELSSHLHAHRHALRASCSVCRANTLTLDALLLHLSSMHSPHVLPMSTAATSDTMFNQALMPTLPYPQAPMSAIASLVSMAACQAGPSSPAFLGGSAGMGGGMSNIMEHIIAYRGLLPCPICQLLCSSKQHLATHISVMHGNSPPSAQTDEREGFPDNVKEDTNRESRRDSDAEGSSSSEFFCFDCSAGFSSHGLFMQHCMLQHNSTSVVNQGSCSVCHKAFDTWKALHAHYLSAHGITNFCDRCKMGFVSTTELKTHYDSMHSTDTRNMTFICDICNKGFYSQSQCSAHKRSHISEKSFACQVCGSAFFKRGDLSKHFRTVHAPNRVFACRFCGKRGTRMDNMRSHVKSHGKHMSRDEVLSFIEEVKS